jgi:1,4-alpha-glucan branching enzyme
MPMHRRTVAALCATLVAFPAATAAQDVGAPPDHGWRRGAVCYEIFVRSFYDSDGDGVGDLNGLIQKLDYINDGDPDSQRDLGARCIWLMPVTQSPSYHGYDVTNYYHVERDYGTNDDFKRLIGEAHRRGIRVLVDLVLNHASSEHPYFKDALLNPGSPYRDWFVWSVTDPGIQGPWGQQVWHRAPGREEYYYGLFWGGMPDLNYETPAVRTEAQELATFWLMEMGADGFRLDAIKHLVEEDYGRVAEHVPATHEFLREFAAHIRRVAPDAFTRISWTRISPSRRRTRSSNRSARLPRRYSFAPSCGSSASCPVIAGHRSSATTTRPARSPSLVETSPAPSWRPPSCSRCPVCPSSTSGRRSA